MTDYDVKALLPHLQAKWGNRACPMCGQQAWNVVDKVFQLFEYQPSSIQLGGPVVPVIPIVCNNCGNTIFVNPIVAKLISPTPPVPATPPQPKGAAS